MNMEKKPKYNVGEELKIVGTEGAYAIGAAIGGTATVLSHVFIRDDRPLLYKCRYEKVDGIVPSGYFPEEALERGCEISQRVTELEAEVKKLKAKVQALENDKGAYEGIDLRKIIDKDEEEKTPNQRRADVIKKARASLTDFDRYGSESGRMGYCTPFAICDAEFIVNREKRTVVCLLKGQMHGRVFARGIAKCMDGDVFNADIGKAIALAKARGKTPDREFTHAPQPTKVDVGMTVRGIGESGYYRKTREFTLISPRNGGYAYKEEYSTSVGDWINPEDCGEIIDDTEAVYE